MSPRKRRRDTAFPEEVRDVPLESVQESTVSSEQQRAEKEQEVWDAIRETHYEAIEQLPLTLHRQLSLMRQLDEHTLACTVSLRPALQKYIKRRRAMAGIVDDITESVSEQGSTSASTHDEHSALGIPSTTALLPPSGNSATPRNQASNNGKSDSPPKTPLRGGSVPETERSVGPEKDKRMETTRNLITHVASMAEELLRASQEKVNLAQANHESVERHIRLLDQAIKEQEATLSAEASRSSNGVAVHLPEVDAPKYPRKSRNAMHISEEYAEDDAGVFANSGYEEYGQGVYTVNDTNNGQQGKDSTSLTITLPATHQNEELYCYCNRVSFGEMIACDGESCESEWFHLGCVGLTEIPEGAWYCEDCKTDGL
ncbi:hypothetical protein CVT25_015477 [Psilocybe cyanescens]|uniref:Chromatin modification-related protein n=1 Tax=Psilocybe cyanescens TaxID=93625 RepID=A0A409WI03_PSICY|nr:hypothetical protein CVT25_015477 [Psilocybe cyanescens]